jgi:DNA polymerase
MPNRLSASLQEKIEERLRYYQDIGIRLFYVDRHTSSAPIIDLDSEPALAAPTLIEKIPLLKSTPPTEIKKAGTPLAILQKDLAASESAGPSIFEGVSKVNDNSLLAIREDIGECTRCKLHKGRNKIVFGDGNPKAQLVFVGEGPGADEDMKGLPFVGRAGKLLTQMIEAMGLQRKDVYICNVVKCRPPQNRAPEPDEVVTCSPYLLRQIDFINPRVIVCLGAVAAKTLLETTRGISQFRGEWLTWRGHKLMATYHPAYLLRNPAAKSEVWKDLQKVMAELGLQTPKRAKSS